MNQRDLKNCMKQLADQLDFRWSDKSKSYVGVHRGVMVTLSHWSGELYFLFDSPTVDLMEEAHNEFLGFTHMQEAGIPPDWTQRLSVETPEGPVITPESCQLVIGTNRLAYIGEEAFFKIPDAIADDFQAHGAENSVMCNCAEKEATTMALLNGGRVAMCDDCWYDLEMHTKGGKLKVEYDIQWKKVLPLLLVLTTLGGFLWGWCQQPDQLENIGGYLLLFPTFWAFGLTNWVSKVSEGVSRTLRVCIFTSVILSVLAGNIWGFHTMLNQQLLVPCPWYISVEFYFRNLPFMMENEVPFLMAGAVGAWIALRRLKPAESIEIT